MTPSGEMTAVLFRWTLWMHIAAGAVAVVAGIGALATTKGSHRHRQAGKTFVAAIGGIVATVFVLAVLDPRSMVLFLALVAVFTGYLVFSGYRVLSRKRPADEGYLVDWVAVGCAILASLVLVGWGGFRLLGGDNMGITLALFGGLGLHAGVDDARTFRSGEQGEAWIQTHFSRMIGAFIATVTAVSVVNLTPHLGEFGVVAWLWPTVVGVPLISYCSRKYDEQSVTSSLR